MNFLELSVSRSLLLYADLEEVIVSTPKINDLLISMKIPTDFNLHGLRKDHGNKPTSFCSSLSLSFSLG